ncbi:hypothetical protein OUZ56_005276 [Daphnia magna]|uniref:Uncharacterized protein n=1 Tax=Daphnia magna TaxID=35525 RepID=A0ABQ9YSB9_9CRUS|nr:hypothetical protein OUZ56_005276 [Daphnia magna]
MTQPVFFTLSYPTAEDSGWELNVNGSHTSVCTWVDLCDVADTPFTTAKSFVDFEDNIAHLQIWLFHLPLLSRRQRLQIHRLPHIPKEIQNSLKITIVFSR